ncbi:MAG: ABC transporter ATP-binding protein [Reyranellaceae bacterium]
MSAPVIELAGITKEYRIRQGLFRRRRLRAVNGVDLAIMPGETVGLVGESGCGKSTVGRITLGLLPPSSGSVKFRGEDITGVGAAEWRRLRRHLQLVFQNPFSALDPRMAVGAQIAEVQLAHGIASGPEAVRAALERVGLQGAMASRYPHQLSGGQQQRVVIARALSIEPSVIVCDEAVSALDVSVRAQIINLLTDLQAELSLSYLFISHDLGVVEHICDRVLVMYLGSIVEQGTRDQLFDAPRHPYTRALLAAVPKPDPTHRLDQSLAVGEIEEAGRDTPGCAFAPRCPHAVEQCRSLAPRLREVGGQLVACHRAEEI